MMPGKLGVDAIIKSPKPPPQDAFSRDQEGSWGWCWVGRFSSGSLTSSRFARYNSCLKLACNLLITQLGSYVQGSFEIGSCQSTGRAKTNLALPIVASCDLYALSTIQKRSWREGNMARKMPYLQKVRVSAIFDVIDKRKKEHNKRKNGGGKGDFALPQWVEPRRPAQLPCVRQLWAEVLPCDRLLTLKWQVRLISRNSSQWIKGWLKLLLIIL